MSLQARIVSTIFLLTEILMFVFIPALLESKSLGPAHTALAAWGVSFISPNVGVYHELWHRENPKAIEFIFKISTFLNYSFYYRHIHDKTHHHFANTMKDYGHPYYKCKKLNYLKRYYFDSFNKIYSEHKKELLKDFTFSVFISALIYYTIGASGLVYQFICALGFYYTAAIGNFFLHYGLETLLIDDKNKPFCAWDGVGGLGKYVGFNLNLHSEHHRDPSKPFENLDHDGKSPRLPLPLPTLILLFPFKYSTFIMNRRLKRYLTIKENMF